MGIRDWIDAIRHSMHGGNRADFYAAAETTRVVPAGELAAAGACLADGGPIADRALRQLHAATQVYRLRARDGSYELRVVATEDLLIRGAPRPGWTTGFMTVETSGGQSLQLELTVDAAGFVGLRGRTASGDRWPREWQASPASLAAIREAAPWLELPTATALRADLDRARDVLRTFLGEPELRLVSARVDPPASDRDLETLAAKADFELPAAYEALLRRANGVEIGSLVVLGTHDAYRLDAPGPKRLVISPPDEDGAFVLREAGAVEFLDIDDPDLAGRVVADDVRTWLSGWAPGASDAPPKALSPGAGSAAPP